MVRRPAGAAQTAGSRPRTRGDGPRRRAGGVPDRQSTPHPRGWSDRVRSNAASSDVDPAPAGMVRVRTGGACLEVGRPRTRGDGPAWEEYARSTGMSTPHPRGWSPRRRRGVADVDVDPAPAGMVPGPRGRGAASDGRPRTRGDGPLWPKILCQTAGSTPHPRGWSSTPISYRTPSTVDPAPAGMVPVPRTHKGAPGRRPAPAGMVPAPPATPRSPRGRPRTRGDGPPEHGPGCCTCWSTPHPRGWSQVHQQPGERRQVDPAPAGMVRRRGSSALTSARRPRTRGVPPRAVVKQLAVTLQSQPGTALALWSRAQGHTETCSVSAGAFR